jgi:hypothetical protein
VESLVAVETGRDCGSAPEMGGARSAMEMGRFSVDAGKWGQIGAPKKEEIGRKWGKEIFEGKRKWGKFGGEMLKTWV